MSVSIPKIDTPHEIVSASELNVNDKVLFYKVIKRFAYDFTPFKTSNYQLEVSLKENTYIKRNTTDNYAFMTHLGNAINNTLDITEYYINENVDDFKDENIVEISTIILEVVQIDTYKKKHRVIFDKILNKKNMKINVDLSQKAFIKIK